MTKGKWITVMRQALETSDLHDNGSDEHEAPSVVCLREWKRVNDWLDTPTFQRGMRALEIKTTADLIAVIQYGDRNDSDDATTRSAEWYRELVL